MGISYNEIAGRSVERLGALSDGVFAFAMTLLVLDLRVPIAGSIHGERDLWHALGALAPNLVTYLLSFTTLGIFWVGQQTQLAKIKRSERDLAWIHLAFLLAVTMVPFSTKLLAEFITYRTALILYWLNIAVLGATLYWSWSHVRRTGLIKEDVPPELDTAVRGRIVVAQSLYALGVLLCIFNTYVSLAFILLVQLNYVFAPRLGILRRL
ncbi:MAG TPA: TMEM175 family protein [Candidatus Baltobacteraceae bacterium]|nr:TMEM175 family protein [Candidatus Baltobacteraceae bacterium]